MPPEVQIDSILSINSGYIFQDKLVGVKIPQFPKYPLFQTGPPLLLDLLPQAAASMTPGLLLQSGAFTSTGSSSLDSNLSTTGHSYLVSRSHFHRITHHLEYLFLQDSFLQVRAFFYFMAPLLQCKYFFSRFCTFTK